MFVSGFLVLFVLCQKWRNKTVIYMSNLYSQFGYPTGVSQAWQLTFRATSGAVEWPLASCVLVHFFGNLVLNNSWSASLTERNHFGQMVLILFLHVFSYTVCLFAIFLRLKQCFIFAMYYISHRRSFDSFGQMYVHSADPNNVVFFSTSQQII